MVSQQETIMNMMGASTTHEDDCCHDEHDHGICLECGRDINDDLVAAAEFAADCREDR